MFVKVWNKIGKWKIIVSLLALLVSVGIWGTSITAVNVHLAVEYGEVHEGDAAQVFFNIGNGYIQENSSTSVITSGKADFAVNPEFFDCGSIRLDPGNSDVPYGISNIKIYSKVFKNGELLLKTITAAELKNHTVLLSGNQVGTSDGSYGIQDGGRDPSVAFDEILTGQFVKAVRNNWLVKLFLQFFICAFYVIFLLWEIKGKRAALTGGVVCGILLAGIVFILYIFCGLPPKYYRYADGTTDSAILRDTGYQWLIVFSAVFCGGLIGLAVFYKHLKIKSRQMIRVLYILLLVFAAFKMWYYASHVGQAPDEDAHIAYIAYLEDSGKIIPQFSEMKQLGEKNGIAYQGGERIYKFSSQLNFLGHPPLYYHMMRLSGGVTVNENGEIHVNYTKLRGMSISIVLLALALWFYAGYTWLDKRYPIQHLLYGSILVCIPMVCFGGAGVNNDTMTFLGGALSVIGMLRFVKEKRDWKTYWMIALGVAAMILGKVTAGAMIILAIWGYLLWELVTKRKPKEIFKPVFWTTAPVYLLIMLYFVIVYKQVGAIQPSYQLLDYEGYRQSWAYTAFEQRTVYSLGEYVSYYLSNFLYTWSGWGSSFFSIYKAKISEILFWLIPMVLWLTPFLCFNRKVFAEKPERKFLQMACVSILAVFLLQFKNAYGNFFFNSGYLGGFQSRYYLCILGIFAYILVKFQIAVSEKGRKIKTAAQSISAGAVAVLMCGDFIYFLIKYADFYR